MEQPRDTHEMDALLLEQDTRAIAVGMIARMRAFTQRWQESRDNRTSPAASLTATRWMLDAIGGRAIVIPGANEGPAQKRIPRYLLTLESPLGWQSLRMMETNEALYAKIHLRLDALEEQVGLYPARMDTAPWGDLIDDSEIFEQAGGLLEHAINTRIALEFGTAKERSIPVGFSPVSARALVAVLRNRTHDEWSEATAFDDFWECSREEYEKAAPDDLAGALAAWGMWTNAETIGYVLDWKPTIRISGEGNRIDINIRSIGHRVLANAAIIPDDQSVERIHWDDHSVVLTGHRLPETLRTAMPRMAGRRLEALMDHWLLRGSETMIERAHEGGSGFGGRREIGCDLRPGPGPVLSVAVPAESERRTGLLRHPDALRLVKDRSSS